MVLKYASTELRAMAWKVVLARNTRGAQSALGYRRASGPNTPRRSGNGNARRKRSSIMCNLYRR